MPEAARHQAEYREIRRSLITPAPYNPRESSAYARKQLRRSLDKFGLVIPPVWNETSGLLVGGHLRLSELDDKEGYNQATKEPDYVIGVAVVSLDPERERQLNVWLNNRAAQGDFDKAGILTLLDEFTMDDLGFTRAGLEFEFGDLAGHESAVERQQREKKSNQMVVSSEEMRAIRKRYYARRTDTESGDASYYVLAVFDSPEAKAKWLVNHGLPADAPYITAEQAWPEK